MHIGKLKPNCIVFMHLAERNVDLRGETFGKTDLKGTAVG
jgi:hypothetical protein